MSALTRKQIRELRDRLDRREAALIEEVHAVDPTAPAPPSKEPHNQVEDFGELGEQRIRDAVVQAEQERDVDELRQIAAAKERMDRGEYGECLDCGVDIAFARLEVQPAAARCVPCQERYERAYPNVVRIAPLG